MQQVAQNCGTGLKTFALESVLGGNTFDSHIMLKDRNDIWEKLRVLENELHKTLMNILKETSKIHLIYLTSDEILVALETSTKHRAIITNENCDNSEILEANILYVKLKYDGDEWKTVAAFPSKLDANVLKRIPKKFTREATANKIKATSNIKIIKSINELLKGTGTNFQLSDSFMDDVFASILYHFEVFLIRLSSTPQYKEAYLKNINPDENNCEQTVSQESGYDLFSPWTKELHSWHTSNSFFNFRGVEELPAEMGFINTEGKTYFDMFNSANITVQLNSANMLELCILFEGGLKATYLKDTNSTETKKVENNFLCVKLYFDEGKEGDPNHLHVQAWPEILTVKPGKRIYKNFNDAISDTNIIISEFQRNLDEVIKSRLHQLPKGNILMNQIISRLKILPVYTLGRQKVLELGKKKELHEKKIDELRLEEIRQKALQEQIEKEKAINQQIVRQQIEKEKENYKQKKKKEIEDKISQIDDQLRILQEVETSYRESFA